MNFDKLTDEIGKTRAKTGPKPAPIAERFNRHYVRGSEGECWEWVGCRSKYGYGKFAIKGSRPTQAHRVSYMLNNGAIPDGMVIMHTCDNPPCVNPSHLRLGTHQENDADRNNKGRTARGNKVHGAILKPAEVLQIRELWETKQYRLKDLGQMFGVSFKTISGVVCRANWRHI
jgi:hypothetical protein